VETAIADAIATIGENKTLRVPRSLSVGSGVVATSPQRVADGLSRWA